MRLAFLLVVALTVPAFAGCLEIVNESGDDSSSAIKRSATPRTVMPPSSGTMTGDESVGTATADVCGAVAIPPSQTYCATKTIELSGTTDNMDELPVTLDTFVGDINVEGVDGNDWSVTVTLEARGGSQQEAIANLDNIVFTWSHEGKTGHHLNVHAEKKDQNTQNGEAARYQARLPADITYFMLCDNAVGAIGVKALKGSQIFLDSASGSLSASMIAAKWFFADTASGSISISDIVADEVHADSASGDVSIQGQIVQTTADTASGTMTLDVKGALLAADGASGSINAKFTPTASGSVMLQTASGSVNLQVPEGAALGYSIDASTTSGDVTIGLKDGKVTGEDEDKHFLTTNYSKRSIQTTIDASSTSSDVNVGAA